VHAFEMIVLRNQMQVVINNFLFMYGTAPRNASCEVVSVTQEGMCSINVMTDIEDEVSCARLRKNA
jgi:hypothetical protein